MKNENNTQRPSPSSPQEQAEPRLEAGEGLDVTACSASSFNDSDKVFEVYKKHMPEANRVAEMLENGEPDAAKACNAWIKKVIVEADLLKC
jgi:hypothetical protein